MNKSIQGRAFCKGAVGFNCENSIVYVDYDDKHYWWADFKVAKAVYLHVKSCIACTQDHDIKLQDLVI
jgi:hypothetical protein